MNDKLTAVGVEPVSDAELCISGAALETLAHAKHINEQDATALMLLRGAYACRELLRLRERSEKPATSTVRPPLFIEGVSDAPVCAEPGCVDGWLRAPQGQTRCPRCQPAADAPRYSCYVEGCPGNHASKYMTCGELPKPKPEPGAEVWADTGNAEADRALNRLSSSDPDFDDCTDAAVLIRRLVAEHKGPDGFATWKDAAVAERVAKTTLQSSLDDARQELGELRWTVEHQRVSGDVLEARVTKAEAENARLREALTTIKNVTGAPGSGRDWDVREALHVAYCTSEIALTGESK